MSDVLAPPGSPGEPPPHAAGANAPRTPGANISPTPGANIPRTPGANIPRTPGANVPRTPGANIPRTPGATLPPFPPQPLLDAPAPRTRAALIFGTLVCIGFFGAFAAWSVLAPLAEAAIAPGVIKVEGTRRTIQHLEGGIVRELLVRDGARVTAGEVLARLDAVQSDATLETQRAQRWALLAQDARLAAELAQARVVTFPADLAASTDARASEAMVGQRTLFEARTASLFSQVAVLQARIEQQQATIQGARGQLVAAKQQLVFARQEEQMRRGLVEKGLGRVPELLALQRAVASLEGNIEDIGSQIERANAGIAEAKQQIRQTLDQRMQDVSTEQRDVRAKLAETEERVRAASDVAARREILAPEDGTLVNQRVFTLGAVLRPGDPIFDLVPARDRMIAEVNIQPTDIDVVYPDLPAEIRLPAFKQRLVPYLHGHVSWVAADVTVNEQTRQQYYRAYVTIDAGQLPPRLPRTIGQGNPDDGTDDLRGWHSRSQRHAWRGAADAGAEWRRRKTGRGRPADHPRRPAAGLRQRHDGAVAAGRDADARTGGAAGRRGAGRRPGRLPLRLRAWRAAASPAPVPSCRSAGRVAVAVPARMRRVPAPGGADDILERAEARRPAGLGPQPGARRDQHRRIAGAPRTEAMGHRPAADAGHGVDHLAHRIAGAAAEIVAAAALLQPVQHADMRLGEIGDMDIVADAGAVRRRVVRAEDGERRAAAEGGADRQRHQVGFGVVILADPAARISAGGVEVAQAGRAQAMDAVGPEQPLLDHQLAFAIGIGRRERGVLVDRDAGRVAEQRRGRGEDEAEAAGLHRGIGDGEAVRQVVRAIAQRVAHALADQRERGEVEHRIEPVGRENLPEPAAIREVGHDQGRSGQDRGTVALAEVVDHHHRGAAFEQRQHQVAADIAGAAGHQELPPLHDPPQSCRRRRGNARAWR